jgi:pimeloyl-ACP methyl ester carboxylesterase
LLKLLLQEVDVTLDELAGPSRQWMQMGRHLAVNDQHIFVAEQGEGPHLLMLHGFPTSAYDWREMMELLGDSYHCVAPDFPGYGLSDKPDAYSYSLFQQADAVEGVAGAMGIERAHLVCHDMATSVVCELLARANEGRLGFALDSVTFTNGSILMWRANTTTFQKLLASNESLEQGMQLCERLVGETYVKALKAIMRRPQRVGADDAQVMADLMAYQQGNRRLPAIAGYMRERYVHRERWLQALKATDIPLQLVWADGDPIAHVEMGRELRDMLPNARYIELDDVGHFLIIEDPERVAQAVREFAR